MAPISRALPALVVPFALLVIAGWSTAGSRVQEAQSSLDLSARPDLTEPVTLGSEKVVLEVTLTAHQGVARLDTVAKPVKNFLVFAYRVERGSASNDLCLTSLAN